MNKLYLSLLLCTVNLIMAEEFKIINSSRYDITKISLKPNHPHKKIVISLSPNSSETIRDMDHLIKIHAEVCGKMADGENIKCHARYKPKKGEREFVIVDECENVCKTKYSEHGQKKGKIMGAPERRLVRIEPVVSNRR